MKHLLTAIACFLAVAGSAQTPYNPDSDGNSYITITDLMSVLAVYGEQFTPNFLDTEEVCIVTDPNNNDCTDGNNIPPITFFTYSDLDFDSYPDYPEAHTFIINFDPWEAQVVPNGTQWWVLTSSNSIYTDIHFIGSTFLDGDDPVNEQSIRFYSHPSPELIEEDAEGNAGLYPRFEKYMWWEGDVIKMN